MMNPQAAAIRLVGRGRPHRLDEEAGHD